MIFDDEAIAELVRTLTAQGWTGNAEVLSELLSAQSAAASVRAFIMNIKGSSKAQAIVTSIANQFSRVFFDASALGFRLYMSNPNSECEASFDIRCGTREMVVRTRDREDDDYAVQRFTLDS